jgi:hypothetical protein
MLESSSTIFIHRFQFHDPVLFLLKLMSPYYELWGKPKGVIFDLFAKNASGRPSMKSGSCLFSDWMPYYRVSLSPGLLVIRD